MEEAKAEIDISDIKRGQILAINGGEEVWIGKALEIVCQEIRVQWYEEYKLGTYRPLFLKGKGKRPYTDTISPSSIVKKVNLFRGKICPDGTEKIKNKHEIKQNKRRVVRAANDQSCTDANLKYNAEKLTKMKPQVVLSPFYSCTGVTDDKYEVLSIKKPAEVSESNDSECDDVTYGPKPRLDDFKHDSDTYSDSYIVSRKDLTSQDRSANGATPAYTYSPRTPDSKISNGSEHDTFILSSSSSDGCELDTDDLDVSLHVNCSDVRDISVDSDNDIIKEKDRACTNSGERDYDIILSRKPVEVDSLTLSGKAVMSLAMEI
ncbi:uncharacterized protein [Ptychodera flava]|uniref:uncharacterized protein n=1 Tax=Ptychodera flava TaxID=63121 RepID=UPI00396A2C7E